jgi:hypothetical protein
MGLKRTVKSTFSCLKCGNAKTVIWLALASINFPQTTA